MEFGRFHQELVEKTLPRERTACEESKTALFGKKMFHATTTHFVEREEVRGGWRTKGRKRGGGVGAGGLRYANNHRRKKFEAGSSRRITGRGEVQEELYLANP